MDLVVFHQTFENYLCPQRSSQKLNIKNFSFILFSWGCKYVIMEEIAVEFDR
jgi:hypothetical protein